MLVLNRKPNESIKIGDDIEIVVVSVRGDTVRLGVTAPRDISVHRNEVWDRIQLGEQHRKVSKVFEQGSKP